MSTVEYAVCCDQWVVLHIGDTEHRFLQAHGCGHRLDRHTNGMKCRECGRDCARADGETLELEDVDTVPVGLEPGRLF